MARTALTAVAASENGVDLDAVDQAAELTDGNSFVWTATRRYYVNNGDDASLTVTFQTPATVGASALAVADKAVVMTAGQRKVFGPFGPEYRRPDGTVWVDYSGTTPTGVMVAALD
ncbi:hypothetical protein [Nonomuraea wenchangensis]|uniref:hypothetical protein n=1 Tax=Nonomuraea wenchangensis TaxID=568860 RepID=UPI00331D6B16